MATPDPLISTFPNIRSINNPENHYLPEVLDGIKWRSNPYRNLINQINKAPHDEANILKLSLPSICFSGTFNRRVDSGLDVYAQLVCIDVDEVTDLSALKQEMKQVSFVYSYFISPSGKGLKILVFHDCKDSTRHADIYRHIGSELKLTPRSDLKFDSHCSNISRGCFFSYDPDLYINRNASVLPIDVNKLTTLPPSTGSSFSSHDTLTPPPVKPIPTNDNDLKKLKNEMVELHMRFEEYYSFYPGVRNRNLNILCCILRSNGIPEDIVSPYLQLYYGNKHPDFLAADIKACVHSVYNFHP